MYVKTNNGIVERFPYTIVDFRNANPMTSFPHVISNEMLEAHGVFPVFERPRPETDRFSHSVKRNLPELVDGQWIIAWDVLSKSAEEIAEETERRKVEVRESRNGKLAACDWTQLADSTADKDAWATYRQALRDVPAQAGFPNEVTWPELPTRPGSTVF